MTDQVLSLLHITTAVVALVAGAVVLAQRKGTRVHKRLGYVYVVAMLVLNLTALGIFRLTGTFGGFHVAALISLATLTAGIVPAYFRRPSEHWLARHLDFMAWSYIGLLAAAVAEAAVRIPSTPFFPAVIVASLSTAIVGWFVLARSQSQLLDQFHAQRGAAAHRHRPTTSAGG